MVNKILIDANILLDYILIREPYFEDANKIMKLCADGNVKGCVAAHSITNMYYVMRKDVEEHRRREILINLCMIFEVIEIDKDKLVSGLENENFADFEDCIQMECAKDFGAEFIVTRNIDDYKTSDIPVVTPKEYLQNYKDMLY